MINKDLLPYKEHIYIYPLAIIGYGTDSFSRVNTDKLRVWNISDPVLFDKDNITRILLRFYGYNAPSPVSRPVIYTLDSSGQKHEINCTPDFVRGQFTVTPENLPKIKGLYHSLFFEFEGGLTCEIGDWLTFTVSADTGEGGSGEY